jgi:hypothetical protein
MGDQLLPLPLTERTVHLCLDMQWIFRPKVLGRRHGWTRSCRLRRRSRTVIPREPFSPVSFRPCVATRCPACGNVTTRVGVLRPARSRSSAPGVNAAARGACPPATVIDKTRYSAFAEPTLIEHLRQREADALVVSGSETDVCVLATVLDAVDIGYRVIVVRDAVCSSSDEGHDMLMRLYHTRYSEQIETADAAAILARWE